MLSLPEVTEGPADVPLYRGDMIEDLKIVSRDRLAERITGGLSQTSKLPCPSWGIPAVRCKVGSLLKDIQGSTCSRCYALNGRYAFHRVQEKLEDRFLGLNSELWTPSMVFLITYFCDRYFRWMDSGDVQDGHMFQNICTVARHTPDVKHWLPTRETAIVRAHQEAIPENLIVRVSATMIDGPPPKGFAMTSTVHTREPQEGSFGCLAPDQDGKCQDCRVCWDGSVPDVGYKLH